MQQPLSSRARAQRIVILGATLALACLHAQADPQKGVTNEPSDLNSYRRVVIDLDRAFDFSGKGLVDKLTPAAGKGLQLHLGVLGNHVVQAWAHDPAFGSQRLPAVAAADIAVEAGKITGTVYVQAVHSILGESKHTLFPWWAFTLDGAIENGALTGRYSACAEKKPSAKDDGVLSGSVLTTADLDYIYPLARESDYPCFRGPFGNGSHADTDVKLTDDLVHDTRLVWKSEVWVPLSYSIIEGGGGGVLPPSCRVALTLGDAFWACATPEHKGTVVLYLDRQGGVWQPTLSADAQRGMNVAHDGYIVTHSSADDGEHLRVRLHVRRDRWMDIVGEAAYDVRFAVDDDRVAGSWQGIVHGVSVSGSVSGAVTPIRAVADFASPHPGEHPRLLIRKGDIPRLREKAETPWGRERLAELRADTGSPAAQGLAYVLTGDAVHAEHVKARIARSIDSHDWFCIGGDQHDPAFRVVEQLIAFDLVYDACDNAFRQRVIRHVADKLEMFYWGAYNTQFNGYDRSNWSLMFRSAAGLMALTVLDTPLDDPDRPARAEILHPSPPRDLDIGRDVPVVVQDSENPISPWLYAGPIEEYFNQDGFADSVGMAGARPEAGTRIGNGVFRLLGGGEVSEGRDLGSLEMRNGAVDLRKAAGGKVMQANYLYAVLEIRDAGYYMLESNKNPKGVRQRTAYLNGERIGFGDHVRLEAGRYPLLIRVWNEPVGDWEPHVFWARVVKVEAAAAMAWHLPRAAGASADALCGSDWRDVVAKATPWNLTALRRLRQAQHEAEGYFVKGLGDFGWNQEGEAYTRHAIRLGIPFALCYRNVFSIDMDGADRLGKMLALCTAATVFSPSGARMQSFNVGGGAMDADLFSRAFCFVPSALQPAVLGAWNKTAALAEAGKLTDPHGIIATHDGLSKAMRFINYPLGMAEQDPADVMRRVTVDRQKGGHVFRNCWRDGDDCVVQFFANSNAPGGTWSCAQGGTFRITGLGHDWAVRGQGYGNGASGRGLPDYSLYQNMVDVEGQNITSSPQAWVTGFEYAEDGSGVVTVNMDEIYVHMEKEKTVRPGRKEASTAWTSIGERDIGIRAIRSFAVDYSGASGSPCLVAVADRLTGTPGTNTWQMTVPAEHAVAATGNTFTVTARSGETLTGTVVLPRAAAVEIVDHEHKHEINYHGDHNQAVFKRRAVLVPAVGRDQDFLVVMTLQRGQAPVCTARDGTTAVGGQSIAFDGKCIRLGTMGRRSP